MTFPHLCSSLGMYYINNSTAYTHLYPLSQSTEEGLLGPIDGAYMLWISEIIRRYYWVYEIRLHLMSITYIGICVVRIAFIDVVIIIFFFCKNQIKQYNNYVDDLGFVHYLLHEEVVEITFADEIFLHV